MRAFLIVLGTLLVGLAVAGCGGDDDKASAPTTGDRAQQSTETGADRTRETTPEDTTTATDEDRDGTTSAAEDDAGGGDSKGGSDTPKATGFEEYEHADDSDENQVRTAVIAFHKALAANDGDRACELLSSNGRKALTSQLGQVPQLKGKGCGAILKQLSKAYPATVRANMRNVAVTEVFVHDDAAFAKYRTGKLPLSVLPLEREDGGWHVGALGGAPADRVPLG